MLFYRKRQNKTADKVKLSAKLQTSNASKNGKRKLH